MNLITCSMNLTDFFTTKGEATDFSLALTTLSEEVYTTHFDMDKSLMQIFGIVKKDLFLKLLRENSIPPNSPTDLKNFIEAIQKAITSLPAITLTVAFEPRYETVKAISNWFVMNLKKQILLDFIVEPNIIAGLRFTYEGKYRDYSFQLPVEQLIQNLMTAEFQQQVQEPQQTQEKTHQSLEHITVGR